MRMRWSRTIGCIALVLCGCQSAPPSSDPFFGRTRVEPPGTMEMRWRGPPDPSYRSSRTLSPTQVIAATAPPAERGAVAPHDGRTVGSGSRVAIPPQALADRPPVRPSSERDLPQPMATPGSAAPTPFRVGQRAPGSPEPAAAPLPAPLEQRQRIVRTLNPPAPERKTSPLPQPVAAEMELPSRQAAGGSGDRVINIMDLPLSGGSGDPLAPRGDSAYHRPAEGETDRIEPVVYLAEEAEEEARPVPAGEGSAPAAPEATRHGFDAQQYSWLRGEIEYSRIDRRWKLRYIPIDGETDPFGGSVVLSNAGDSWQLTPGEWVEVHGQVVEPASQGQGFAPLYEIARLHRLGP